MTSVRSGADSLLGVRVLRAELVARELGEELQAAARERMRKM